MKQRKCCSGCGAKDWATHEQKIRKGLYGHTYDGPSLYKGKGRHRKGK